MWIDCGVLETLRAKLCFNSVTVCFCKCVSSLIAELLFAGSRILLCVTLQACLNLAAQEQFEHRQTFINIPKLWLANIAYRRGILIPPTSPFLCAFPVRSLIRAWIVEGQVKRNCAFFHRAALQREETWMYFIRLPEGMLFPVIHRTWIFPTAWDTTTITSLGITTTT